MEFEQNHFREEKVTQFKSCNCELASSSLDLKLEAQRSSTNEGTITSTNRVCPKGPQTKIEVESILLDVGLELLSFAMQGARSLEHYFPTNLSNFVDENNQPLLNKFEKAYRILTRKKADWKLDANAEALQGWMMEAVLEKMQIMESPPNIGELGETVEEVMRGKLVTWIKINHGLVEIADTTLALHGSPIGNWFNIIRTGLQVMSGTEFQANGAQHGSGIYCSFDVETTFRYCSYNYSFPIIFGVIEVPATPQITNVVVVPKASDQKLRFVCICR